MTLAALAVVRPAADQVAVVSLLDRYAGGDFAGVSGVFRNTKDFDEILAQLKRSAPTWLDAGGSADRPRRVLAAATFALEAAYSGAEHEWKLVQSFIRLENISWHAPPQLIEWGCTLLREAPTPMPAERVWHLATLAVAARAGDFEFLIGSPWSARANPKDEIEHLTHSAARFPRERRFALAQGIAAEWLHFPARTGPPEAQQIFELLQDDEQVGGEATVRLGLIRLRSNRAAPALALFEAAEHRTREPFVVYLARYFRGQALERLKRDADAALAYRGALAAMPHAQSASFALAALLAREGRRSEAAQVVDAALSTVPRPVDPWRAYGAADARFWPELIEHLHAEIRR
jgi:tetratricopeptide (TPR) repeat protein